MKTLRSKILVILPTQNEVTKHSQTMYECPTRQYNKAGTNPKQESNQGSTKVQRTVELPEIML